MNRILVLAEHDNGALKLASFAAAGFAAKVCAASGGSFDFLLLGSGLAAAAEGLRQSGAAAVLAADSPGLAQPLADRCAQVVAATARARGATIVVAAASTFSKDILPRAAALLDAGMLSDVIDVRSEGSDLTFRRVMFAGNVIATVQLDGPVKCIAVRSAAFAAPAATAALSPVEAVAVDAASLPQFAEFISREVKVSARPDATEARIIVSGGRALKNAADFERLVGGLADVLGAAVGSSRALVDSGITPNSLQIGQTGKVVAPDLYFALGISGAIQHMAGMKDTKVIAAINKDPEAPIFEIADYGLVADVYEAVPELMQKLKT
ncbi:MAG: electron transfer flavoprotein subunit alpha/FixB family protein [Opitutae bacterium]|nr:electron transfer flavoprotein subunit alpha/FixB family protein [Opitutae bacterium]